MIRNSTIQLLRFHFSFFLMPVYWFALSMTNDIRLSHAVLIFIILHLLVYPASNGYNSYMDRDTGSIGGIRSPKQPTRQLYYVSMVMDLMALLLSSMIGIIFFTGIAAYILASRAYSYRGIRLKKYPVAGYITVIVFQGAVTFFLVMHGSSMEKTLDIPLSGMLASSFLVGSFYPLSQIYQHKADQADGVNTLSILLGSRGTFLFSAIIFALASIWLWICLEQQQNISGFFIIQLFLLPVTVFFSWWFFKVYQTEMEANFTNTMRMNIIASVCTNAAFIFLLTNNKF